MSQAGLSSVIAPPAAGKPAPRHRRYRGLAWTAWLAVACFSAFGLGHYRIANDLSDWVPESGAVGAYKSYVLAGWETAAADPAAVASVLRGIDEVALCIDPITVKTFGRLAGVTPDNFVTSVDGRYAGVFCFSRPGVPDDKFVAKIRSALDTDARTAHVSFALGGPAVYHAAMDRISQQGLPQLMAVIPAVGLLVLWWVIGRFAHALASVVAISLSQIILLGLIGWLRIPVDMSVSMVPPMMMCLGFSYAAHRSLRRGNAGTLAVCALTTAAGVGSFAFTPLAPVRQFALLGMLGLALVWAAAATLLPPPVRRRRVWLRPVLEMLLALRRRRAGRLALAAIALAVTAAAFAAAPALRFETDPLRFFPPGTPEVEHFRWLDRHLTGMLPFQVTLRPEDIDGLTATLPDAGPLLRGAPGVRKVIDISFSTPIEAARGGLGGRTYWCLADNDALAGLDADQSRWRDWGVAHQVRLEWRGVAAQLAGAQRTVVRAGAASLPCMAALAALAGAWVATGSFADRLRAAAVGGWVSLLPAAALIALAAAIRLPLGLPALMIGAITVGVAVDDTLHLTSALRRRRGTLRASLDCWRPCAGSSIVAASTLALFALSPFGPTRQFGLLMSAAVLLGALANHLIAASVLLPPSGSMRRRAAAPRLALSSEVRLTGETSSATEGREHSCAG